MAAAEGRLGKRDTQTLDRFDRATRSRVMSRNRSHGTKTTEWKFRSLLTRSGISGWVIGHDSGLPGKPDVIFLKKRVAIFLDGCFWHGCPRCRTIPTTNREFWTAKIEGNKERDRKTIRALRKLGWKAIRIWEHDLENNVDGVLRKIMGQGLPKRRGIRSNTRHLEMA
jgi:DNA mismatch endonuclease (patch repair protein)